jgi:1,4-dihydroxy-2-naphthoate octaprenyltransferase
MKGKIYPWILAARPKTLTAGVIPVLAGTAIAYSETGIFRAWIFAMTLGASILVQIATNLLNDAIDFRKGADAERKGPVRVTQMGLLSYRQVFGIGIACLVGASLLSLPLIFLGGLPILFVAISSVFLAYGYTGGPFPLAYLGLGDVFVVLYFGVVAVLGTYYLQTDHLSMRPALLGLQIGLAATVLIAINNLRDIDSDRRAGKLTLAVRLGAKFTKAEICICALLPLALSLYWITKSSWQTQWGALFSLGTLPIAIGLARSVSRVSDEAAADPGLLGMAAANHALFGILFSAGTLLCKVR